MSEHDNFMPDGWHAIKSVLLTEISTAANFHLCREAASALFHARLIGEEIAKEEGTIIQNGNAMGMQKELPRAPNPSE